MDGSGLLALDDWWQARVDGVLDRPLSLTKNRDSTSARDVGARPGRVT
ncbi:MAG TPA: hypothetical protein VHU90_09455 [Galbitalea sp.]|jgi:hypothetical protein|nr:hypothetical protein [Galbitalea sp.]